MEPAGEPGLAPAKPRERITNLDALRGIAVLGILLMNGVSFGLPAAAYFNLSAAGTETPINLVVGAFGEIFIDHKMMGLFSVLFGAGIALFLERARARTSHPVWLSLWRNLLLFGIGVAHSLLWEGDILVVYAICAPFVMMLHKARPALLFAVGAFAAIAPIGIALAAQTTIPPDGAGLGDFWYVTDVPMSDAVGVFLITDFFGRAFGMMLIGVGLYRIGILNGTRSRSYYQKMAGWGFGIGVPIAAIGVAIQVMTDFSPTWAVIGEIPNTVATIPVVLGFIGVITIWNNRSVTPFHLRIRAVGRMALTNYLMQSVIGVIVLQELLSDFDTTRLIIALFVVAVWAAEVGWSKPWLDRFTFGPVEWLWRTLTYRSVQPFKRPPRRVTP